MVHTDEVVPLLKRLALMTCGVIVSALLIGCGESKNGISSIDIPSTETLHTEVERGPVKVAVDVSPKEPRLSDEPKLTLTITAADGVKVDAPPFGQSLGEFVIRDFHEPIPKRAEGHRILQQVYTLEPTRAGPISVAPISVRFVDNRPDGDGGEHTIETEALTLNIDTIVPSEAPSLNDLRPPAPPEELPRDGLAFAWLWIIGGIILLVGGYIILRRRRTAMRTAEPQLSPQELANRELRALISGRLSETDVKAFFVELTGIVRRYIERSTGVRAPEQTTEEFLREVNANDLFPHETNARLGAFLESADLVKFAGYQPDQEGIKQGTHRAKQFIELKAHAVALHDHRDDPNSDDRSPEEAVALRET
ncbi:MAG: hypothetical protein GY903_11435 [Fuerstiella sp.]|nr:hypothetical protein [Fuerstiella sp.]MCP4855095.1 hypothetical protein [Fuerstiella sp.]